MLSSLLMGLITKVDVTPVTSYDISFSANLRESGMERSASDPKALGNIGLNSST